MSLSPAAQELDEDLCQLFSGKIVGPEPALERIFGAIEGVPRTIGESRDLYRVPIVEAFQASGAETLAEFPERVKKLARSDTDHQVFLRSQIAALQDRVAMRTTERDQARAEAEQRKKDLTGGGQNELYVLRKEWDAAKAMNTHLVHERDMARGEADRYHAELVVLRESEHKAKMNAQALQQEVDNLSSAVAERDTAHIWIGALQRELEAAQKAVSDSNAEEDRLRVELDGAQQQLRHVIELKDRHVIELKQANAKVKDLAEKLTLARDEAGELYATERRLRERIKWAMARIQDLLLGGDL